MKLLVRCNSHRMTYKCKCCPFKARNKYRLQNHKKLHARMKLFHCTTCTFSSGYPRTFCRHIIHKKLKKSKTIDTANGSPQRQKQPLGERQLRSPLAKAQESLTCPTLLLLRDERLEQLLALPSDQNNTATTDSTHLQIQSLSEEELHSPHGDTQVQLKKDENLKQLVSATDEISISITDSPQRQLLPSSTGPIQSQLDNFQLLLCIPKVLLERDDNVEKLLRSPKYRVMTSYGRKIRKVLGKPVLECRHCDYTTQSETDLSDHKKTSHGKSCSYCSFKHCSLKRRYQCRLCPDSFSCMQSMTWHILGHAREAEILAREENERLSRQSQLLACQNCDFGSSSNSEMALHNEYHGVPCVNLFRV